MCERSITFELLETLLGNLTYKRKHKSLTKNRSHYRCDLALLVINLGLNKQVLAMLDESVNGSRCNHSESLNSLDELEQLVINGKSKYLECRDNYL